MSCLKLRILVGNQILGCFKKRKETIPGYKLIATDVVIHVQLGNYLLCASLKSL